MDKTGLEDVEDIKLASLDLSGNAHLVLYPEDEDMKMTVGQVLGDRSGTLHVGHYQVGLIE